MRERTLSWLVVVGMLPSLLGGCAALFGGSKGDTPLNPGDSSYVNPGPWAGPLAQKHAGKVLFSSKPIAITDSDDSSLYSTYELGAPLYVRFFSKEAPINLLPKCTSPRAIYRVAVNGEFAGKASTYITSIGHFEIGNDLMRIRGAHSLTTETSVALTTPSAERKKYPEANEMIEKFNAEVLPKLQEGNNTLRIVIDLDCGASNENNPIYAEGTLNITVKPGALAEYISRYGDAPLEPSPNRENEKLVPEILEVMKTYTADGWSNENFLGARVLSRSWTPVRNELTGILTARSIDALVVVRAKNEKNPEACRLFTLTFTRDAAGGPLYYGGTAGSKKFLCSLAPK